MLRIPYCLDNRLTDGGKVVSPTHPPQFTSQKHYYFYVSGIDANISYGEGPEYFNIILMNIWLKNLMKK
jgi:hypothetical protein